MCNFIVVIFYVICNLFVLSVFGYFKIIKKKKRVENVGDFIEVEY